MLHRGNITITGLEDINRHPTVSVRLENGNVWLTKHELARLFGVFIQTIDANMRILNESEATITEKQDKLYVTYYNLEAVIFLSFRINTYCTKLFREWVLNSLCCPKSLLCSTLRTIRPLSRITEVPRIPQKRALSVK